MELNDLLNEVSDEQSFLRFARALMEDGSVATEENGWQNSTINGFLDSAIAWAEASGFGISQGLQSSNPWRQFAVFSAAERSMKNLGLGRSAVVSSDPYDWP